MTGRSPPVAGADTLTWRSSPRSGAGSTTGLAVMVMVEAFDMGAAFVGRGRERRRRRRGIGGHARALA
ncbi:hypothetical protein GCM10009527_074480 [Actinomadura nitritigenes]